MLLNLHSYYSLRYGTFSPEKLLEGLEVHGYDTAVLTDINNSTGTLDCMRMGREAGLNILAGMEYREGDELLYIGIARNGNGFEALNALITERNRSGLPLPRQAPPLNDVYIIYPLGTQNVSTLADYEYIGIRLTELNRIAMDSLENRGRYVILHPVSFRSQDYKLHCQLRAIDHNILISQLEEGQCAPAGEVFLTRNELLAHFRHFPDIISNTERLMADCSFQFDFKKSKNKQHFKGSNAEDKALLRYYAQKGWEQRYGKSDTLALERVEQELHIIGELEFSSYFLITDDICSYARSRGFSYIGRGSGANSVVAYCLGITDVCPITLNLYFERFLNPKRQSPPDFDIDFSWKDRDAIFDYVFKRYPAGHVALVGTVSTFQSRSTVRELGKIYGLPKGDIDRLIYEPEHMLNKHEVADMILGVCKRIDEFPNQRSVHASGLLVSELPLTYYTALDYPPKGLPTTQMDMYAAEDMGFEKFDLLSQRGIGHIEDCVELVAANKGKVISVSEPHRFFEDKRVLDNLKVANTIGCFYIESPAMRQLLAKLQCDSYLCLVAASSIIRPGVASSGMMQTYIARHHHPETVVYPHAVFKEQLKETYGVMVYQEDVMKIGHFYGGLNMADADVLRRMMSGKYRHKGQVREIEEKYFRHCREMGYPEEASREIWRQIESFASFSFNKAHSASFAVESFQSLYLKAYYPLEFMVAVLNNYGGFYQRKVYVSELKRIGGNLYAPCVNRSDGLTTIDGKDIYLGFDGVQRLGLELVQIITQERDAGGSYIGIEDFIRRTGTGLEQVVVLIRCGAFRFTGQDKKALLWSAHLLFAQRGLARHGSFLFESPEIQAELPRLESCMLEDLYDELELLGFPVSDSMFSLARSHYRGEVFAHDLHLFKGKIVRMVGDFVAEKKVSLRSGGQMKFGTFLDCQDTLFDTVHFAATLAGYPLQGNGLYLIEGRVIVNYGVASLEVIRCAKMSLKPDPRSE